MTSFHSAPYLFYIFSFFNLALKHHKTAERRVLATYKKFNKYNVLEVYGPYGPDI